MSSHTIQTDAQPRVCASLGKAAGLAGEGWGNLEGAEGSATRIQYEPDHILG